MPTPNEIAIYEALTALLDRRLSFEDFSSWLLVQQRTLSASDPARRLPFRIIAKLDEYDSSEMADEQLRAYLLAILPESVRQPMEDRYPPNRPRPTMQAMRLIYRPTTTRWFIVEETSAPVLDPKPGYRVERQRSHAVAFA